MGAHGFGGSCREVCGDVAVPGSLKMATGHAPTSGDLDLALDELCPDMKD